MNRKITNKMSIGIIYSLLIFIILISTMVYAFNESNKCKILTENGYNRAFYGLVNYVQNVETYLAKAMLSKGKEIGIENLTNIWKEASVAQSNLSQLPLNCEKLGKTAKFLNQISDYSYYLSRKNIKGEDLSQIDLDNIKQMHKFSLDLENSLNQLSEELNKGIIKWDEISKNNNSKFATEVGNVLDSNLDLIEENLHEYAGLIYDGAFSEHITTIEKRGLIGNDISQEDAKNIVIKYYGKEKIDEIESHGLSENAEIPSYDFRVKLKEKNNSTISISKKGGFVVFSNYDRNIKSEKIKEEEAIKIGKKFLEDNMFKNMNETYYYKQNGIITINFANIQKKELNEILIYPDLIKVKIALDNGDILGIETKGYLNSHYIRKIDDIKISKEKAKEKLNKEFIIEKERLTIIPTKWKTEKLCWEFKGKMEDNNFLIYINALDGKEEDILMLIDSENGTLTH